MNTEYFDPLHVWISLDFSISNKFLFASQL